MHSIAQVAFLEPKAAANSPSEPAAHASEVWSLIPVAEAGPRLGRSGKPIVRGLDAVEAMLGSSAHVVGGGRVLIGVPCEAKRAVCLADLRVARARAHAKHLVRRLAQLGSHLGDLRRPALQGGRLGRVSVLGCQLAEICMARGRTRVTARVTAKVEARLTASVASRLTAKVTATMWMGISEGIWVGVK